MRTDSPTLQWLLSGDVSVQYQTRRDLLKEPETEIEILHKRIESEGWGKALLESRDPGTRMWGNGMYSPKWISTHYTLLDLHYIGLHPQNKQYRESSRILLDGEWMEGGYRKKGVYQDVCIVGMLLTICCTAVADSEKISQMIDYLMDRQYPDGGWNCLWQRGHTHSSLHTTLNVLEGLLNYTASSYNYRVEEIKGAVLRAHEFILQHRLYKSHRTGEIIDPRMLVLSHPRWRYDILRCLDYFQSACQAYDERMEDALDALAGKMNHGGRWKEQAKIPGAVHFHMEQAGRPGRWNTLRALRVLKTYRPKEYYRIIEIPNVKPLRPDGEVPIIIIDNHCRKAAEPL